jgi:cell division protein FtsB
LSEARPTGRFRSILIFASVALVLFLLVAGFRGYRDLTLAKAREAQLEQSIGHTEEEIGRLERKVERLQSDPVMLERLAREELGMVRPGEVVVLLEPEGAVPPATPTSRPPSTGPSSDPPEPESP